MHSSCHICWRTRRSGSSLRPVSLHRSPLTAALGFWPPSYLGKDETNKQKQNKTHTHCSTNPIIRLHPTLFPLKLSPASLGTLNVYVTFDHRTKRSSHPAGSAGDSRQGPLLSPDGRQTATTLRQEEQNSENQNKIRANTIHFAPLKFLLVRFRHRKYSQVPLFCLTWLIISVNGQPAVAASKAS